MAGLQGYGKYMPESSFGIPDGVSASGEYPN